MEAGAGVGLGVDGAKREKIVIIQASTRIFRRWKVVSAGKSVSASFLCNCRAWVQGG